MLLGAFVAGFAHGLLVIEAPECGDTHDGWDAATELVHAGPSSLYVSVRDGQSGLVKVSCVEGESVDTALSPLFSGSLELPDYELKFYDPNETISMLVTVESKLVAVNLYSDDPEMISELLIQLTVDSANS